MTKFLDRLRFVVCVSCIILGFTTGGWLIAERFVLVDGFGLPLGHSGRFTCPHCGGDAQMRTDHQIRCLDCKSTMSKWSVSYR